MRRDSRDSILARLWATTRDGPARPESPARPAEPTQPVEALREAVAEAGGELLQVDGPALGGLESAVAGLGTAEHVWSALPEIPSRGAGLEETEMAALADLDFTVLRGVLAVAESGAVWNVPRSPLERAAALLAEHLVLVVPQHAVVGHLHDAYLLIDPSESAFGWFLSGPSKTADIEQSLVLGAHGPRRSSLVLA